MKKVIFLLFISILFITGCSVKKTTELSSSERFAAEYSISEDNPFLYATIDEVLEILEDGTGIIFFANSDCEWCIATADILNDALNYKNIDEVYYYNPKTLEEKSPKKYKKLIQLLEKYLEKNEEEEVQLYLPDVYFVKDGKIIGHNNDTATMNGTVDEALTKKNKKILENKYLELISDYNALKCTDNC